ncbi:nitrate ABC transporter permease [Herpetosiphon sp.]|uniref:Nitrate ABC transporter, inner membrane subunit n=1 Tax=Herpetosiphon aurantiacus (strain ATCC 23779 / DSM 785 / 114-95) TaxID=316274 RepID=A9AY11_HERA2|nr:nitrate ABC transporter permease [Herpetosiphon sp.]ABX04977.1 nitrate ABC transporter, inner membrane subunit [Herpetosiphon aurantiacus DSM 785]
MAQMIEVIPRRESSAPTLIRRWLNAIWQTLSPVLMGMLILAGLWQVAAWISGGTLPTPLATASTLRELLSDPFYDNGPNDKGIGIQLMASLGRVFTGWGIGIAIAIPLGMLLGSSAALRKMLAPVIEILRPVSPLAWYPLGLAVLHNAPKAVVFAIVITSLWPTLVNTTMGVQNIPADLKAVSKVFRFSRWRYISKVLLPAAFPAILTGMRLSMGIAWMVIVAGEMLAGGTGLGFFVWDSWNALSLERVMSAILVIGITGLALDRLFSLIGQRMAAWQEGGH